MKSNRWRSMKSAPRDGSIIIGLQIYNEYAMRYQKKWGLWECLDAHGYWRVCYPVKWRSAK